MCFLNETSIFRGLPTKDTHTVNSKYKFNIIIFGNNVRGTKTTTFSKPSRRHRSQGVDIVPENFLIISVVLSVNLVSNF